MSPDAPGTSGGKADGVLDADTRDGDGAPDANGGLDAADDPDTPSGAGTDTAGSDDGSATPLGGDTSDGGEPGDTAAPAALPACLGASLPLVVSGQGLPYAEASLGTATGWFLLDWATTASTLDPFAFAAAERPQPLPGTFDLYEGFGFFGPWGQVHLNAQDHSGVAASVRQAGILGTDFLALHVYTLDFGQPKGSVAGARPAAVYRAEGAGCDDPALTALGLAPLSTAGYYSNQLGQVNGPNVPTVPVRIGGAEAVAQLDTGFDDVLVPGSINVNAAFFAAIPEAEHGVRRPDLDLTLTTCVGLAEPVEAWALQSPIEFVGPSGEAVRSVPDGVMFVKRTPAAALACGGIGTWSTPAAQVGASILSASGLLVFDPLSSRVWLTHNTP